MLTKQATLKKWAELKVGAKIFFNHIHCEERFGTITHKRDREFRVIFESDYNRKREMQTCTVWIGIGDIQQQTYEVRLAEEEQKC